MPAVRDRFQPSIERSPPISSSLPRRSLPGTCWLFYLTWLPSYLQRERGVTLASAAGALLVIYIAADLGSVFGGWLPAFFLRRRWSGTRARLGLIRQAVDGFAWTVRVGARPQPPMVWSRVKAWAAGTIRRTASGPEHASSHRRLPPGCGLCRVLKP